MIFHIVERDDSISKIAKKYKVSEEKLIKDNGLANPDELVIGQAIIVTPQSKTYKVKKGDSIYKVSMEFGVPLEELIRENSQVKNPYFLLPGEVLTIPDNAGKDSIIVNGYSYPFLSIDVLKESLPYLTYLSVFSYEMLPDGTLNLINDFDVLNEAEKNQVSPRMVISNIGESGVFEPELAREVLSDTEAQDTLINGILSVMREKGYKGVDLDFENLYPEDKNLYNEFLKKISKILHREGYQLSAAIEKKTSPDIRLYEAHDYRAHGIYDDQVILMTYDWGYLFGPPMAISPLNEVEKVIQYAVTEIPPEKILLGIPNYAFDWTLPYKDGDKADPMSHVEALHLAWEKRTAIQYSQEAQSPFFQYIDDAGVEHEVWFEDARSIQAKLDLVKEYGLGGVSYWTVNKSFPQNWTVLKETYQVEKEV